jgi:CMP-N-acetylneuraminic acid synthetase
MDASSQKGDHVIVAAPTLFLVPARDGSKRITGKNLRLVGGIPLVGWAVRTGLAAAAVLADGPHRVVCSTDDDAIAATALAWGAEVIRRPSVLASDDASSAAVALDALYELGGEAGPFETLVLLQPTSPLTDAADVVAAVDRHHASGGVPATSVVGVHPAAWHNGMNPNGVSSPANAVTGPE